MSSNTISSMKIEVKSGGTLAELQKSFNDKFPYLKIEFFTQPHEKGKATSNKFLVNSTRKLSEFISDNSAVIVDIDGEMKVSALEKMFADNYGLYIQVFRRSGKIWLETTATDDWTLETQNEEGRDFTNTTKEEGDIQDYHEQE
jgi:hypothetical protein